MKRSKAASTSQHFLRGSAWMIAMRWSTRAVGLVSTIILARLLAPQDFGIIAMAMILVGLLELLAQMGVDLALIRNRTAGRRDYDSAWTIQVLLGIGAAAILALAAPWASEYFDEPRLTMAVRFLALRALIAGFENIGTVEFRKELDFGKEFRFNVYKKLITFVLTITLAFFLRNYWALLIGLLASSAAGVLLSYRMHSYRPGISFSGMAEIWSFSRWVLVWRIAQFANEKLDQFIVGGLVGTSRMGGYYMAAEIATMPTVGIVNPVGRSLYPNLAHILDDREKFGQTILQVLAMTALISMPAGFGFSAVAAEVVPIVLGAKWIEIVPLMEWLAIFGPAFCIASVFTQILLVTDHGRIQVACAWSQVLALAVVLPIVGRYGALEDVAMARTLVAWAVVPLTLFLASRVLPVAFRDLVLVLWRPTLAALVMLLVLRALPADISQIIAIQLLIEVIAGAALFAACSALLWLASGQPDGPERTVILTFRRAAAAVRLPRAR